MTTYSFSITFDEREMMTVSNLFSNHVKDLKQKIEVEKDEAKISYMKDDIEIINNISDRLYDNSYLSSFTTFHNEEE